MAKNIAILGSTGSIGCNTLEVIDRLGTDFRAVAISGHSRTGKLLEQVRRHRPRAVGITSTASLPEGAEADIAEMRRLGAEVYFGQSALVEIVEREDVDFVLAAVVGAAGLPAVLSAVRNGKTLALANKESLVLGGSLLIAEARKRDAVILPVDSEHSALFQAMLCGRRDQVRRVILTASGGPFRCASLEQIERATLAEALNHPTWRMGNKITIDSATMFNKALEIIEACWLFDLPGEQVEVVIHPESVVHSMVEFIDGSVIAQLSPPDMRTPIQYALTYPHRADGISRRLDLTQAFALNFQPPDPQRFPALRLAYEVAARGGTLGAVMNAANEAAVEAFIAGKIPFGGISRLVELTMYEHRLQPSPSLDDLQEADSWARTHVRSALAARVT
ncbi:MAG TPA: 1-deoxy-D-xylulose-5-phosphate reductoisomerase [Tepidisphaeraceae bacterium]|nr:1-deoxy-D-xylulose-5-phosphate reductoisomerase [Tepidisphaeraceae bacterium]